MPSTDHPESIYQLMWAIRKYTRTTLLFQHLVAKSIGLNVTDAECIDFLQEMGPSTAGNLAKATGLTTGAITNVIDRLEKAGFVKRSHDPVDRRKVIVSFLPEKHTNAKIHYTALAMEVQALLSTYDEEQLDLLIKHTEALEAIYHQQTAGINNAS
ncbi:MarR family winged helix-turn-helix transcriptional regulator [Mucilaginibacter sp. AW1-3]